MIIAAGGQCFSRNASTLKQTISLIFNQKIKVQMNTQKNMAVIGLGSMGYGMAVSLLKSSHKIWGFARTDTKVEKFVAEGGTTGNLSCDADKFDIVLTVVVNDVQTESVLFGKHGVVPQMKKGSVIISCATVEPSFAKKMAGKCRGYGVHYLDAPISGGSAKAMKGRLSILASGSKASFEAAKPALDLIAETVFDLGDEPGMGSAMKIVNQLLAGVHIAVMGEAMTFGISQGLSPEKILEVIPHCAGTSWMFENRAPHIVKGDYSPHSAIDIWPKDLGIVLDMAKTRKFPVPLAAAALLQFLAASESGLGREDDAAVAKVYARNSGVSLPGDTET